MGTGLPRNGYYCGPGWTDGRCDSTACDHSIPYCYDGGNGDDNFGCDMSGDEAGACCNGEPPNAWFSTTTTTSPTTTCDCSCHWNGYYCGPGATDPRCDATNCDHSIPYCYDGGNGGDNFGCDMSGDEAGACCTQSGEPWSCDCSCHSNGYYCGPGWTDERCEATNCDHSVPYCYDGGNGDDNFGCDMRGDEAGACCNGGPPYLPVSSEPSLSSGKLSLCLGGLAASFVL